MKKLTFILSFIFWACFLQAQNHFFEPKSNASNLVKVKDNYFVIGISKNVTPLVDRYFIIEKYDKEYNYINSDSIFLYSDNKYYYLQNINVINDTISITGYFWNIFYFTNVADPRFFSIKYFEGKFEFNSDTLYSKISNTNIPVASLNPNSYSGVIIEDDSIYIAKYYDNCQLKSKKFIKSIGEFELITPYCSFFEENFFYIIYDNSKYNRHSLLIDKYDLNLNLVSSKTLYEGMTNINLSRVNNKNAYILVNLGASSSIEMEGQRLYKINLENEQIDTLSFGLTSFDFYYDIDFFDDRIILTGRKNKLDVSNVYSEFPIVTSIFNFNKIYYNIINENDLKLFWGFNYEIIDSEKAVLFGGTIDDKQTRFFKELGIYSNVAENKTFVKHNIYLNSNFLTLSGNLGNIKIFNILGEEVQITYKFNGKNTIIDFTNTKDGIYFLINNQMIISVNYTNLK